jgi:hypothetical protein
MSQGGLSAAGKVRIAGCRFHGLYGAAGNGQRAIIVHEGKVISEIVGVGDRQSMESWRDVQNRPESDPDSDLTDLVPALSRLLGWLCEPENCERRGMRVTALVQVVRPDLNGGRSLGQMSPTSKQNISKLIVDFRATFCYRPSAHQVAKNGT